jgi:hypothetical protein
MHFVLGLVRTRRARTTFLAGATLLALGGCAGPIIPHRSKPGGAARWAAALASDQALLWAPDAVLYRIAGAGVGTDGWLPDRGGAWRLRYRSAARENALEVTVDGDGRVGTQEIRDDAAPWTALPRDWLDSPKIWAATRGHERLEPVHTLDSEFGAGIEPERFPREAVWRIRFWLPDNSSETHVVTADGRWRAAY